MLFEECDKNLTEAFIKKHGTPIMYHDGIGQYDTDNKLIKEFQCKFDCCKMTGMSDKTLRKALTTNNNIIIFFTKNCQKSYLYKFNNYKFYYNFHV